MKPWLKRALWIIGGLVGFAVLVVAGLAIYVNSAWDNGTSRPVVPMRASSDASSITRGEYLFKYTHTCWECHSPERASNVPPSGGRAFDLRNVGPGFGIFYARNITPDTGTGIGAWSDGEVVRAIREGIRPDGKTLFPIMPIEAFRGLSDDDALAIVSYLRSISPVASSLKESVPSFFAKSLYTFGVIKPSEQITEPVIAPARGVTREYGKYLANNAAACMECHTPRNLEDGSFHRDSVFAGSTNIFGLDEPGTEVLAYARNITPDIETGIGNWTEDQFFEAVRAGMRPDGTVLAAHMPYSYYGLMDNGDLRAIFVYLKSIPAIKRTTPPPTILETYRAGSGVERGKTIFYNSCMICHGDAGKGAPPTTLSIAEIAPTLDDKLLSEFIAGGNVGLRMPSFGKTLSSEQIKDVVAYIRTIQKPL
jgi:mono/diheme cytochrome c family protein